MTFNLVITPTSLVGGGVLSSFHKNKKIELFYNDAISLENLFAAWQEFVCGKRKRKDVQYFSLHLADNIYKLHKELKNKTYIHGNYHAFRISDPKPREIHKASVRDRLVHHALHRKLYPEYERFFIADSYSCRTDKGVHKALERFQKLSYKVSKNNTRTCWILKCDVRRCFASIDHETLLGILEQRIVDQDILGLLESIITSFSSMLGKGLPLGNLTSQLLVNIYLNEFDQFVKHKLKAKYYIRYTDDFVIFHHDKNELEKSLKEIEVFLNTHLKLFLHPRKVSLTTLASGVDFLGWVHFFDHRVLRTVTKRRMLKNLEGDDVEDATIQSYLGLLKHGNARKLKEIVIKRKK